jgi:chromosome partitioning protein
MAAKIIAIANQKGGVTKTTTSTAISLWLKTKFRVLHIDTDPQCNSSDTYQAQIEGAATLYDLLTAGVEVSEAIQHTPVGDIIPSDPLLKTADTFLNSAGREYGLKKALEPIMDQYDYIIIDTPPALGVLLLNALTVADTVIVPVTADRYSLQGLSQLYDTIKAVKEYTNPNLTVAGLLLARFNGRTNLGKECADGMPEIADMMNTIIFKTAIRECNACKEAQSLRMSLYEHAPTCNAAQDYIALVDELLERGI